MKNIKMQIKLLIPILIIVIILISGCAPMAKETLKEGGKMVNIDSSAYGSITINGVTYDHDVYIFPSGKVEEREYGHTFTKEQVEHVLKENPKVVVIGKGTSGMASLSDEARALLENKGIEIVEDNTPDIRDKFNKLAKTKKVAAIIHVTCS